MNSSCPRSARFWSPHRIVLVQRQRRMEGSVDWWSAQISRHAEGKCRPKQTTPLNAAKMNQPKTMLRVWWAAQPQSSAALGQPNNSTLHTLGETWSKGKISTSCTQATVQDSENSEPLRQTAKRFACCRSFARNRLGHGNHAVQNRTMYEEKREGRKERTHIQEHSPGRDLRPKKQFANLPPSHPPTGDVQLALKMSRLAATQASHQW